ncbi:MAG: Ig-like domain-containing protein [Patescibacteria group bacterium]|jgi:hypothetical protein
MLSIRAIFYFMEEKKKKKRSLLPVLIAAIVLLLVSGAVYLVRSQAILRGGASQAMIYSPENSYIFGSPLTAKANDQEKIKVSVFLLNNQGLGIEGRNVELTADPGVNIEESQSQTDTTGQAVFYLTSPSVGRYQVKAQSEGQPLPQVLTVNFK